MARLYNFVCVEAALRSDCLRARLRVQEKLAHLVDIFELDFFTTRKASEYGRWGEELQCVSVMTGHRSIKGHKQRKTNRSELVSPRSASLSSTPAPSCRPSTLARNWTTFAMSVLL